ncbi:MAG: PAQR family membrane homeostasis protein TrhA [Bacillota bacterium]
MHSHLGDRLANAISHGIGVLLSVAGLIYLLIRANTTLELVAFLIYGISLVSLYSFSTIHHAIKMPTDKGFYTLKGLDYIAIYLLIVGTYTPFVLLSDSYPDGITLLFILWSVAIIGILIKITWPRKWHGIHVVLYLLMGWSMLIFWSNIGLSDSQDILRYVLIGGIFYSGGIPFFVLSAVKKEWHFIHLLWHLCVLGGSVWHFIAVVNLL